MAGVPDCADAGGTVTIALSDAKARITAAKAAKVFVSELDISFSYKSYIEFQ